MANQSVQTFTAFGNSTWTAPAGVTQVTVVASKPTPRMQSSMGNPCIYALDANGNVYGWGYNQGGELGISSIVNQSSPVLVLGGLNVAQLHIQQGNSNANAYFLTTSGKLFSVGNNSSGQLGDNSITNRSSPVQVVGGLEFATVLASESGAIYGLTQNGTLYSWGNNDTGQLGDGTTANKSSPVKVVGGQVFNRIHAWGSSAYGLTPAGTLFAWGGNSYGQLGDGTTTNRSSPVQVVGGLTFAQLPVKTTAYEDNGAPQAEGMFAITNAGVLYAWGQNGFGQLGVGDTTNRSSPVAVVGGLNIASVYPGLEYTMALTNTGAAYGWGNNVKGQLGDNTTVAKSSPVAVAGGLTFTYLAINGYLSGQGHVLGVSSTGAPFAWGFNNRGQLGDGTIVAKSSPVAVVGGLTFTQMVTTGSSPWGSAGITPNGNVWTWGDNTTGSLGDGTSVTKSSPVQVIGSAFGMGSLNSNTTQTFNVVPGTSYTINVGGYEAFFNGTVIATNFPTSVSVYFEE